MCVAMSLIFFHEVDFFDMLSSGKNAKSVIMRALLDILGRMICHTVQIECLGKARGVNNDSLKSVRDTRLVLFSESNGGASIDVGTYNALVCGEETTAKVKKHC
jgi:phage/plasmid-associated DNA primase